MSKSTIVIFYIFDFLLRYITCANESNRQIHRQTDGRTDTHTHTHTHTEMDKLIAIGKILHICLKINARIKFKFNPMSVVPHAADN